MGEVKEEKMIGAYLARRALLKAFNAMNRHDLPTFMSAWHEQGSFTYPGDIPESGTFEGRVAAVGFESLISVV